MENIFIYEGQNVRIFINEKNEPEFCASDVTNILGYLNGRDAIIRHCKPEGVLKHDTPTKSGFFIKRSVKPIHRFYVDG